MGCVPNLVLFATASVPGVLSELFGVCCVSGDAVIASLFEIASFIASFLGRPRFLGGGFVGVMAGVSLDGTELEGR